MISYKQFMEFSLIFKVFLIIIFLITFYLTNKFLNFLF
jgi:hypothetical protein